MAIYTQEQGDWSLYTAGRFHPARLPLGPGLPPTIYRDSSILLMAVVQKV
jgi:hypothetical protein